MMYSDDILANGKIKDGENSARTLQVYSPMEILGLANVELDKNDIEAALSIIDNGRSIYPADQSLILAEGLLYQRLSKYNESLERFLTFIQYEPFSIIAILAIASSLSQLKRFEEAEFWYRQALAIDPSCIDAIIHLANKVIAREGWIEAKKLVEDALKYWPDHSDIRFAYAYIHEKSGLIEDAIEVYRNIFIDDPHHEEAVLNLLNLLYEKKRFKDYNSIKSQVVKYHTNSAPIISALGNIELIQNNLDEALHHYKLAVKIDPGSGEALCNLGAVLEKLSRFREAKLVLNQALEMNPLNSLIWNNLGNVHSALSDYDQANVAFQQSLLLQSNDPNTLSNYGSSLDAVGRTSEALDAFNRAIVLDPDHAGAHWNKGLVLLRDGNFSEGWALYEWRNRAHGVISIRHHKTPRLPTGQSPLGKKIVVHWEQGLGDTIQFCRFIPRLVEAGARVQFEPQACLHKLMSTLKGKYELILEGNETADFHIPLMSLPAVLSLTEEDFRCDGPYLSSDNWHLGERFDDLSEDTRPIITICWQGSYSPVDRGRSVPLAHFIELSMAHPEYRFISVQKGAAVQELREKSGAPIIDLGPDFDNGPDAFCDTASLLSKSALLISVDTSVAHLGGALGVPTWTLLQHYPDWRWMRKRKDTPWYPKMKLFWQEKPGDWACLFRQISFELGQMRSI